MSVGERPQSPPEEAANSLSHATGFVLAATAWPVLLDSSSARADDGLHTMAVSLFTATMMLLYLSPALLFRLIWSLAIAGALLTLLGRLTWRGLSTGLYLALGWLVLLAAIPALSRIAADGVWLLVGGGLAYTSGAGLFLLSARLRFAHLGWHLFVLAGSALHFTAALLHTQPRRSRKLHRSVTTGSRQQETIEGWNNACLTPPPPASTPVLPAGAPGATATRPSRNGSKPPGHATPTT